MHAGGVVIAPGQLTELRAAVPRAAAATLPVTQFDKDDVEAVGLVKFDFLGLTTLTIIEQALSDLMRRGEPSSTSPSMPLDDATTYELLADGEDRRRCSSSKAAACATCCASCKPDRFEDIIALVALYRPGPMDHIPSYIDAQARPRSRSTTCIRCSSGDPRTRPTASWSTRSR